MSKLLGLNPSNCLVNWFRYRLPGDTEVYSGSSEEIIKGLGKGFVIAPFSDPQAGLVTIPCRGPLPDNALTAEEADIPASTSKDSYLNEVETIIRALAGEKGKIVAARVIRIDMRISLSATFDALCEAYPHAFVFMFSTPATGTWIGASPELLLTAEGMHLKTMALAGTRAVASGLEWDRKNIEEQEMVADFIVSTLSRHCVNVKAEASMTCMAGPVEHICTPIAADIPDVSRPLHMALETILASLSPTPALCGSDREKSMRVIAATESFPREMYGGFCGPCGIDGKTAFYVNLRSAKCSPESICVFAGGGITNRSVPEEEWNETEMKSKTIINKLKKSEE